MLSLFINTMYLIILVEKLMMTKKAILFLVLRSTSGLRNTYNKVKRDNSLRFSKHQQKDAIYYIACSYCL